MIMIHARKKEQIFNSGRKPTQQNRDDKDKRFIISAVIASLFFFNTTALAGGLYISEFGTPSMGVASAGAQAVASDASTAFHNPAEGVAGRTLAYKLKIMRDGLQRFNSDRSPGNVLFERKGFLNLSQVE